MKCTIFPISILRLEIWLLNRFKIKEFYMVKIISYEFFFFEYL